MTGSDRRAAWVWLAILIPLGVVLALCAYWEPMLRDGWGHLHWYREGNAIDASMIHELVVGNWRYENPRLGQTITTVLYAPGPQHVLTVVGLGLGVFALMTTMVLGRWPSLRSRGDALAFVVVTSIVLFCVPQIGPMLFYRPFFGNYTAGLFLQLLWLVPYRLQLAEPRTWRVWWSPLLFVLGVAAGMCNEHVGPAFVAAGAVVVGFSVKRGDGLRPWMILGLLGFAVGYALLMVAPGHAARYHGLATQAGPLERLLDRGVVDNLRVLGVLVVNLAWALPWIVLGALGRWRSGTALPSRTRAAILGLAAMGLLTTLVLLGSPKLGPRLYLHSVALLACALAAWVFVQLTTARLRVACAVLSCVVIAYVAVRCVVIYRVVGPMANARIASIRLAPPGTKLVLPRYPFAGSRYFLGDDFGPANLREAIAGEYGLQSIELAPD